MTSIARRGAAAALTVLALGSVMSACGSKSDETAANPPVWPALGSGASGASSPTTAPDDGASSAPAQAPGSQIDVSDMSEKMQQAADATTTAHATMTMNVMGQSITADGDIQMKPMAESMTMKMMGMDVKLLAVDKVIYMKLPAGMGAPSDKWIKADLSQLGSTAGMGDLDTMTNPLALYTKLGQAMTDATYVGSDATGEHYSVKLDTKKMLTIMGEGSAASAAGASLPKQLTEDAWFDADHHLVKSAIDMGSLGKVELAMSDFGKAVTVTAPPADQVEDMSSLGGGTL